tara:strand:- start:443 stop:1180 length:738 start_codon:yes stop_codon:yes gene_type:complete
MLRNVLRSYCYKNKELFYTRRSGSNHLYLYDNSILKEFDTSVPNYKSEYNILDKISHKNIININDAFYEKNNFYTVMPYYRKGDLWQEMNDKKFTDFLTIAIKLVKPITYIHKNNFVHLDIKPENYVIDDSNNYILIDFEHARNHNDEYYQLNKIDLPIGTDKYMAPEIRSLQFGPTSDVYSLGRTLYAIIARRHADSSEIDWLPIKKNAPELENIIIAMLQPNHLLRPTIFEIYREISLLLYKR